MYQVVELYRHKRCTVLSTHWWRWTAALAGWCYQTARPNSYIDVWRA